MDKNKAALGQSPCFDIYLLRNLGPINYLSDTQFPYFKVGLHTYLIWFYIRMKIITYIK